MKRFLSLVLVLLMTVSLFSACGAQSVSDSMINGASGNYGEMEKGEVSENAVSSGTATGSDGSQLPQSSKLIRKLWLSAETEDMDPLLAKVDARISELGGYIESRQIYHGSPSQTRRVRSAEITQAPHFHLQSNAELLFHSLTDIPADRQDVRRRGVILIDHKAAVFF